MSPENHIGFLPALGRLQRTLRCLQSKGFLDASADVRCTHMPCARSVTGVRRRVVQGRYAMVDFRLNGKAVSVDAAGATPLLWIIREHLQLTGTKFGCGAGLCGACMVHVDGQRAFACQTSLSDVAGKIDHDDRGPFSRSLAPIAEGLDCRARAAMRLLPVRADHERRGAARRRSRSRRASRSWST